MAAVLTFSSPGVRIDGLRDTALSWHIPPPVPVLRGLRLCMDAGRTAPASVKIAREVMRSNPRIGAADALLLGTHVVAAARANGLQPQFLAATLLQESAFDPAAMSSAGAAGIAQFTAPTAREYGVDPWEPRSAIAGAAHVLAAYVYDYRNREDDDTYALALAAYNAGPAAVQKYGGVPPYAETREYIVDVRDRWSRMVGR
ncbi:MAG TPA: lytic transglycosylase domain-containing protein [Xanthomonadales bacterium]|nr:lytic transglycosylase domain-containing protein [Xanthomonadales bacterium]